MSKSSRRNRRLPRTRITCLATAACSFAIALFALGAARAQSIQVPLPALPPAPSAPGMLVSPADLPALQARRTDPAYKPWYDAFRGFVDARIARLGSALGDDALGRFAKAAAMLEFLGERPPASSPFARYRDAAAQAIALIGDRSPNVLPGSGTLEAQYDASTLQCMAEAFDLLYGSGLSASQEQRARAKIAQWAGAIAADLPLSLAPNNIMAKAGAALVSAALAVPDQAGADAWLRTGTHYVNRALADKLSPEGWWREGPHYANYTLDNLISAAWHVRNRTGLDWFQALRPMVRYALDAELPNGRLAPYEEGVTVSFPHHTLLAAFAGDPIASEMARSWQHAQTLLGSYLNQQQHDVTAFCLFDQNVQPAPFASGAPVTVRKGDENLIVLRSGYDRDAVYLSVLSAIDYSLLDLWPSRHNTANPLDLVLFARGATLLPTSGGGPLITRSPNRSHYLDPHSKHTILVNDRAPFLAQANQVAITDVLDDEADTEVPSAYLDAATTTITGAYQNAQRVERTVALLGGTLGVVADEVRASGPVEVTTPWRGRGARKLGIESPSLIATRWSFQGTSLEHVVASAAGSLSRRVTNGFYAETWNHEESISGIEITTRGAEVRMLHLLEPHSVNDAERRVIEHSGGEVACLEIQDRAGESDWIGFAPEGRDYTLGPFGAKARLAFVHLDPQGVRHAALLDGTAVRWQGQVVLQLSRAASCVLSTANDRVRIRFAADTPFAPLTVRVGGLAAIDPQQTYGALHNGVVLDSALIEQRGPEIVVRDVAGGGVLLIAPASSLGSGSGTGSGSGNAPSSNGGASSSRGGGGGCTLGCSGVYSRSASWVLFALLAVLLLWRRRA